MVTIEQLAEMKPFQFIISFNEHKGVYETVSDYYDQTKFISEDEYNKAVETGDVFEGRIYPRNSVGFYAVCANDYSKVIEAMHDIMVRKGDK